MSKFKVGDIVKVVACTDKNDPHSTVIGSVGEVRRVEPHPSQWPVHVLFNSRINDCFWENELRKIPKGDYKFLLPRSI